MKSLLSGVFWGTFVGGTVVTVASLAAPQPAGNTPPNAPLVQAPTAAVETPAVAEDTTDVTQADTETEVNVAVDQPGQPLALDQSALPDADTNPLALPATAGVNATLTAPALSETPDVLAAAEDPVLPNPQSVAPQIPVNEDELVVSTQTAAPPAPAPRPLIVTEDVASAEPVAAEAPQADDEAPAIGAAPIIDTQTPTAPEIQTADDTPGTALVPGLATPEAGEAEPEILLAQNETDEPALPGATPDTGAPVVVTIIEDTTGTALPAGASGVVVNRSVGETGEAAETAEVAEPAADLDPTAPALARYAAVFENAANKPTMSLIVVDDGTLQDAVAALTEVPFPVTVALDPATAGASEAMKAYRAAGIEVVVMAKLPAGARPSDVEVAFGAAFSALPEAVAVIDTGDGNLQGDRAVMAQAMAALADEGRGLITVSQGLNTGLQSAADTGVPAGLIFRDLDGADQGSRVIQRFLDQAAFRARQESGVVLLARLRPETLDALTSWGEANRAGQVAMAPVSAILSNQ